MPTPDENNAPKIIERSHAIELVKQLGDGDPVGTFEGYASTFGGPPDNHMDIIDKGAFRDSLKVRGPNAPQNVMMFWQHDRTQPIGAFPFIGEDNRGLRVKGELTLAVQKAAEAYALLQAKAITQMSVGIGLDEYTIDQKTGVRTIHKARLIEISLVSLPANERAMITGVKSIRDWEQDLRDAGVSRNDAKVLAKSITEKQNLRDAGDVEAETEIDKEALEAMKSVVDRRNVAVKEADDAIRSILARTQA